ncbi:MAG TPA: histidine phosphatase family protein [Rhodanobacteraceae bacterium]|nr:histidine phosphatase family protein [Rhodanobacteraceae bacterium]
MRELLLLRHAEAMQSGPDGRDGERPLSLHGEVQARATGAWLDAEHAVPDVVLCSPARRAQMTLTEIRKSLPVPEPVFLPQIYQATPGVLLTLVEAEAPEARQVLLVGHNPGLEQTLALLTEGRSAGGRGLAPSSLAWIELAEDLLEPGRGRLRHLFSP